jgi:hypothetical protein
VAGWSVDKLKEALNQGPVAVQLNARAKSFVNYRHGILDDEECKPDGNHAVLAVGYGTDTRTGKEYFIIKNSWGSSWGEGGYARISASRNKFWRGMCGILEFPYIAFVKEVDTTKEIIDHMSENMKKFMDMS